MGKALEARIKLTFQQDAEPQNPPLPEQVLPVEFCEKPDTPAEAKE
jgi:hypothetical protein